MPLIQIIRDRPPAMARCRAAECKRQIEWVLTAHRGKRLPVDAPLRIAMETPTLDGGAQTFIDSSAVHWKTCPAAAQFSQKQKGV